MHRKVWALGQTMVRFTHPTSLLPGGVPAAALLHLARAVCRRAERRLVTLVRRSEEEISLELLAYLNRLGDLLFVLARAANAQAGEDEPRWTKPV